MEYVTQELNRPLAYMGSGYFESLCKPYLIHKGLQTLRVLKRPIIRGIISLLDNAEDGLSVTEIYTEMKIEQAEASQLLAMLRQIDLVTGDQDGRFRIYRLNRDRFDAILKSIKGLAKIYDDVGDVDDEE